MRITKTIAEQVAFAMTQKSADHIADLKTQLRDVGTELYKKSVPNEVMASFLNNPDWHIGICSARPYGPGITQYISVPFSEALPQRFNDWRLNTEDSEKIYLAYHAIKDAEKERENLIRDIQNTLVALRTFKRVETDFPEAVEFFPKEITTTAVALPIADLKSRIAAQG